MRILLVDDDIGVVQSLLAVLKKVPEYDISVATTGENALLSAAAKGWIDLLITDVVMEPMDGFTLRDEMLARYPEVRTILISGYDLSDYPLQTEQHQLLAKPIDPVRLLAAVAREFAPDPNSAPMTLAEQAAAARRAKAAEDLRLKTGGRAVPPGRSAAAPHAVAAGPRGMGKGVPTIRTTAATSAARASAAAAPPAEDEAALEEDSEAMTPADTGAGDDGLIGQTIGAYQILSQLGEGRWGRAYAAVQLSVNRPVGLKLLDEVKALDPGMKDRFIADARAKAGVQHPSILAVYEAGESEGRVFFAHEYVDGQNLAELKASGEKIDENTALKILRVAAEGLAYLNIQHIHHLPPSATGLFLGVDGNPRLANLATHLSEEQLSSEQEIQALGRVMVGVLPAIQSLSPGLQSLLKRMLRPGPEALTAWGQLLQGLKALEPKVVPVEAAKISARDRAAIAAVEAARKQQKRSIYIYAGSLAAVLIVAGLLVFKFLISNERSLEEQVDIPAGEYLSGNGVPVNLPEFWIDKYEVTYGQYAKFALFLHEHPTTEYDHPKQPRVKAQTMHEPPNWLRYYGFAKVGKPARSVPIDLNCPVMEVDFWDAYSYAKWKGRDLPTEQEWEKAARGTKGFVYPWGDNFDPKKVNSGADHLEADPSAKGKVDGYNFWNPVDKVKGDKSPFGVIGMAGNVREWTGTWDASNRYPIIRGGSFSSTDVRLDQRTDNLGPATIHESLGFRTVSHLPPRK